MWRWNSLVFLVLIFKHIAAQPVSDDCALIRQSRQVLPKHCCPCVNEDDSRDSSFREPVAEGSDPIPTRLQYNPDCICQPNAGDSQGASSLLFPTALRAADNILRPSEQKDLKPIFNPEVGLASSVLETLREATDEEYRDALARDAAKSAAKAAEDFLSGDATPQESANLVTIVVNPRASFTDEDDVIPQASHIQQARCINPPQSFRSSSEKSRLIVKPNSNKYKPKLSNLKSKFFHRNVYDMDSGMSPSNVHEHVVPADEEDIRDQRTDTSPLRVVGSSRPTVDDCIVEKASDFGSNSGQNNLKDLNLDTSSLLQRIRAKSMGLGNLLEDETGNNDEDPYAEASTIHQNIAKKLGYFRNYLPIQSTNPKIPLKTNSINFKDVELIPVKELIDKLVSKDERNLRSPYIIDRDDIETVNNKNTEDVASRQNTQLASVNNAVEYIAVDPETSPSLTNNHLISKDEQTATESCDEELFEEKSDVGNAENNIPFSSMEIYVPSNNEDEFTKTYRTEDEKNDFDTITDASNDINKLVEQNERIRENDLKSSEEKKEGPKELFQEDQMNEIRKLLNRKPKLNLLKIHTVDKTLSNMRNNIAKQLDDLKIMKTNTNIRNVLNSEVVNNDKDNKDVSIDYNVNQDDQCQNEATNQIETHAPVESNDAEDTVTTLKPHLDRSQDNINDFNTEALNGNVEDITEPTDTAVSLHDLQTLSDSMLQEEQRERDTLENKQLSEITAMPTENTSGDTADWTDVEESASTTLQNIVKPDNEDNFQRNDSEEDECKSDLALSKTLIPTQTESDTRSSNFFINSLTPIANDARGSESALYPVLTFLKKPKENNNELKFLKKPKEMNNELKSPALEPNLNNFKEKLTHLFEKENRDLTEHELTNKPKTPETVIAVMATDASTSSFQSRLPPSGNATHFNFDIFDLKSQTPKLLQNGQHLYKTELIHLPNNNNLKQNKLQSGQGNKDSLNAHLPLGRRNSLLGANLSKGTKTSNVDTEKLRMTNQAASINNNQLSKKPRLNQIREEFDLPVQATNNMNIFQNRHKALKSQLKKGTNSSNMLKKPFKSSDVLQTLSRSHKDINDKLRGLHMDLQYRLERMRNELIDRSKSLTMNSHNIQSNFRSSNKAKKEKKPLKYTWQSSTRSISPKLSTSRKPISKKPGKLTVLPKAQNKFRMPTAASVTVLKSVPAPKLMPAPTKSLPLTLQRSNVAPSRYANSTPSKLMLKSHIPLRSADIILEQQINSKKDKVKVSISTTPRPVMERVKPRNYLSHVQRTNIEKKEDWVESRILNQDHEGSASNMVRSKIISSVFNDPNQLKYSKSSKPCTEYY